MFCSFQISMEYWTIKLFYSILIFYCFYFLFISLCFQVSIFQNMNLINFELQNILKGRISSVLEQLMKSVFSMCFVHKQMETDDCRWVLAFWANMQMSSVTICGWHLYVYFASSNPLELEKAINDDLNAIHEWLLHNKLILNVKKCQFMSVHVGSKRNCKKFENVSMKINNVPIERVNHCKYLGVIIDTEFTWKPQVN